MTRNQILFAAGGLALGFLGARLLARASQPTTTTVPGLGFGIPQFYQPQMVWEPGADFIGLGDRRVPLNSIPPMNCVDDPVGCMNWGFERRRGGF